MVDGSRDGDANGARLVGRDGDLAGHLATGSDEAQAMAAHVDPAGVDGRDPDRPAINEDLRERDRDVGRHAVARGREATDGTPERGGLLPVRPALVEFAADEADALPAAAANTPLDEPLTRKEIRVLQLLAEGYSNSAMAEKLFVSDSTVRTHLRNINMKLNARSRTQAVAIARRLGVL